MAMKKVVIFDLDGTLTNSLASMKLSGDMAMAKFGMGPYTEDQYKVFVGDGARVLVERCLIAGGDTELKNLDAAYEEYCKVFEKYRMYKVEPYDGIRELLSALKEKEVKIAVLSNKPHERTKDVIKAVFGEGYFDVVQGQQDDVPRKPSPIGVFKILEKLSLTPEDLLYIGDTGTDMQTGKAAGAFTVGALWGFRTEKELTENHADVLIKKPQQLLDYLA